MPLYDFRCANGHVMERIASRDSEEMLCTCGLPAQRQAVNRINSIGFARTPLDQRQYNLKEFQEASAEVEYAESKHTDIEGKPVQGPSLWGAAKRKAKHLQSLGVKDSEDLRK